MKKQRFDTCIINTSSKVSKQPRKVLFRDEQSSMDEPSMMLSIPHSSDLDSTILTAIDRSDIISLGALMYGISQPKKQPDNKKFKPITFIEPEKTFQAVNCSICGEYQNTNVLHIPEKIMCPGHTDDLV